MKPVANTSGMALELRRFGIELRHGLRLGHGIGEAVLEPGLERWLHGSPFRSRRLAGLLVAGNGAVHAFPGAQEIEAAIVLHQLHRLIDHALQLVVVSELDEAGQRKVLAQRMALKAVIGEEAPEIGVAREQDAVEVVGFALEPVGAGNSVTMLGTGVSASVLTRTRMR